MEMYMKMRQNGHFQADFTDKGATNLARTGTCKVVMHAASELS